MCSICLYRNSDFELEPCKSCDGKCNFYSGDDAYEISSELRKVLKSLERGKLPKDTALILDRAIKKLESLSISNGITK